MPHQLRHLVPGTTLIFAPITEHIVKDATLHGADIMDFAAEVLLARIGDPRFPQQNKLRLIRVLGAAGSPRYNTVLLRVWEQLRNEDVVKEHAPRPTGRRSRLGGLRTRIDRHPGIVAVVDASALAAKPTTAQGEH